MPTSSPASASPMKMNSPPPPDLTGMADTTDLVIGVIPRVLETIRHGARRRDIELGRRPLAQGLVRALLVIVLPKGAPLSQRIDRGRPFARNARSKTGHTPSIVGGVIAISIKKRLWLSLSVKGSTRC